MTNVMCPCGAKFERPASKGRPQIWCPACTLLPHAKRVRIVEPSVVVDENAEPEKPRNQHDKHASVRDQLEAEMAIINAEHCASAEAGEDSVALGKLLQARTNELYARLCPSTHGKNPTREDQPVE